MLIGMLLLFYVLLITPIQGGIRVHYAASPLRGVIGLRVWGIGFRIPFHFVRNQEGQLRLESVFFRKKKRKKEKPEHLRRFYLHAKALLQEKRAKALLKRGIFLESFTAEIQLHLPNAAHTALFSALAQMLLALTEKRRIHIVPNFSGPAQLHLQCIVRFRLGTLLTACAMGAISHRLRRKKEEAAWNIPSDA